MRSANLLTYRTKVWWNVQFLVWTLQLNEDNEDNLPDDDDDNDYNEQPAAEVSTSQAKSKRKRKKKAKDKPPTDAKAVVLYYLFKNWGFSWWMFDFFTFAHHISVFECDVVIEQ